MTTTAAIIALLAVAVLPVLSFVAGCYLATHRRTRGGKR